MQPFESRVQSRHSHRTVRLLALVMVFAVTALFSLMPFKVPRVAFFPPAFALEAPSSHGPEWRAIPFGTSYADATALEPVHGLKKSPPFWAALLPVAPLFAGAHTLAALSPWKARRIAVPPPVHVRLRAPPALG